MDIQATPADIERLLSQSDWLRALARKLVGDASTADDLVQDTWIAALQNPPDPDRPVRPWLAGILRRVASMRARAEGRRSWRQRRAARKDELPSAASLVGEVDLQQRLSREVLELDEPYRTTLLLRYFHDLPAVEIARRQGIPAGTVRWRLKRGLDDLRARLDRSFGDRRSWCLALVGLARREPAASASATGSAATLAASAAILALLGLGTWALVDRGRSGDAPGLPRPTGLERPGENRSMAELERVEGVRLAGAPSVVEGDLHLRLVEPSASTNAGLHAVALHADGRVTVATSDAEGRVRFAGRVDGGEGVLWVDRPGSFIAPVRFAHAEGLQELRLPDGAEFAGTAEHSGEPVPAGFVVELDSDVMLPWGPLPAVVADRLGVGRRATAVTDALGRFRFHSLPADYTGVLWLPKGWRLAEYAPRGAGGPKHDARHVGLGDSPLDLDVAQMPAVRGAVQDGGGAPAAGVRLHLRLQWSAGQPGTVEAWTDADGAFEADLPRADLLSLVASIEHEDGRVRVKRRRRPTAPPLEVLDLGLLTLSDVPPGVLEVRGPTGPLAAARLWFGGAAYGPTGEDGRLEPPTAPGRGWVGAPGHRPVRVSWDAAWPEEISLEPISSARLRLVDGSGASLPGVGVRPPTARDTEPPLNALWALTRRASRIVDGRAVASPDGWIELVDLPAGEPLQLEVLDALGRPLDTVRLRPLAVGERREVEHVLAATPRRLLGRCAEESGEVLLGVFLDFETASGDTSRIRSDPEGRFELAGLAPEPLAVTVSKRGFLRRRVTFAPDDLNRPQEIRLGRSCDLVVHAVDGLGQPHARLRLEALRGEARWLAAETAPGEYELLDLPREPVLLEWSRGEHSGSAEWDPGLGPAELEIGPAGCTVRGR